MNIMAVYLYACSKLTEHANRFFLAPYYGRLSLACPALPCVLQLPHIPHDLGNKKCNSVFYIKCVHIVSTNFIWNFSQFKKNSARHNKNVHMSSCEVPLIFGPIYPKFNFVIYFTTSPWCKFSWKSLQQELSCYLRINRRTNGPKETRRS